MTVKIHLLVGICYCNRSFWFRLTGLPFVNIKPELPKSFPNGNRLEGWSKSETLYRNVALPVSQPTVWKH